MKISVAYEFLPKQPSSHAAVVMDHFGIGFETGQHVIAKNLELPVDEGNVILLTGASGSGKSSLMRSVAGLLERERQQTVLNLDLLVLPEKLLVDALELPVRESLKLLSACGLGEAQLMLRTPGELSDGQRYRFRLALALSRKPQWILADEFTAALDRPLAKIIAGNVRKHAMRTGTGFLLATTHEDITDELQPHLHVQCRLDGQVDLTQFTEGNRSAKKRVPAVSTHLHRTGLPSGKSSPSPQVPSRTGRISLGGITGVTTRASSGL